MVNFADWMNTSSPADESRFAVRAWNLIQRKPETITIKRGKTSEPAQVVRIEYSGNKREIDGTSGASSVIRGAVIFGVRNHPTVADTNIKRGDLVSIHGQGWRVTDVRYVLGGIQADVEAMS